MAYGLFSDSMRSSQNNDFENPETSISFISFHEILFYASSVYLILENSVFYFSYVYDFKASCRKNVV